MQVIMGSWFDIHPVVASDALVCCGDSYVIVYWRKREFTKFDNYARSFTDEKTYFVGESTFLYRT